MTMSVALLHAYRDPENPSMRQYAVRLGHELERRGLRTAHVAPPDVFPPGWRGSSALSRIDGLWGRYVRYPALARRVEADVIHVVDHSHAHLVAVLPRARTVVTCHDVILLALAAGRIETEQRWLRPQPGSSPWAARATAPSRQHLLHRCRRRSAPRPRAAAQRRSRGSTG